MKIEVLTFEGCPNAAAARELVERGRDQLEKPFGDAALQIEIEEVLDESLM